MSILAEIGAVVLGLVNGLLTIYMYVVFAAVLISWVNADPYNPIVRFIRTVTEPVLAPVRRRMWKLTVRLQIDFSPMVVILGLVVVEILIRRLRLILLVYS